MKENIYFAHISQKKAVVAILISDKLYFREKNITSNKEGNFVLLRESIHPKVIPFLNIYVLKTEC